MSLFIEEIPPATVPSILGELQNYETNLLWFVRMKRSPQTEGPAGLFPN
jgi:hypothetical protein